VSQHPCESIAVLSVPIALVGLVEAHLDAPRVKRVPEIGHTYYVTPLWTLAGLGLPREGIELAYFATYEEAVAWAEGEIEDLRLAMAVVRRRVEARK
jgi:hypothetical protein